MYKNYAGKMILSGFVIFLFFAACDNLVQSSDQYRLSYNGNGSDEGMPPVAAQVSPGAKVLTAVNSGYLTKDGYYFAGWNTQPDGKGTSYKPGRPLSLDGSMELYAHWVLGTADKKFHAVTTDNIWYMVEAKKLSENDCCIVYGDMNENIDIKAAEAIAEEYKINIHNQIVGVFGYIAYTSDNGGKLILLLLDIIDGYDRSGGYVAGYFDSTHMYIAPKSNQVAMLFMDVYPGDPAALKNFCTVVAHELQHLINFSSRKQKNTWINEGLSLAAEYIYGGEQIIQRINYFNGKNTSIPYGNNFFVWDGYWEQQYGDILPNYATAYLFFRWLGIQAPNSNDIYADIVDSSYSDYRAITESASSITQEFYDWKILLGTWMLANYYQKDTGLYGYKNQLKDDQQRKVTLTVQNIPSGGSLYPLFPGEGVFSSIPPGTSLSYTPVDNIYYVGLPASTPPSPLIGPVPYFGKDLLSFNGNTNENGQSENGYVASVSPGATEIGRNPVDRKNLGSLEVPPGNYPVDFREMAKKNRSGGFNAP
ncbi:MAG: InlB B-repeat-containing protein [Spirochaetaceae bacterium]|jgi:uncharacterized repeat protein (TIGR02543 family)|nr:InlB B-repeat-containing protein [Spirochaetaceae bacterium]